MSGVTARSHDVPPYVPHPERLEPGARAEVAAIWTRRTLVRSATAEPARVPIDLYRLFIDIPEITAAAGRHLGVGKHRVVRTAADEFDVEDHEGTRAHYRVILRTPTQRVIVARARRTTRVVGEVRGATVTVLTLVPGVGSDWQPEIVQRLESAVRIHHRIVAMIARVLVPLFPSYADRKIGEVFAIATRVAAWAAARPDDFCLWLGAQPDGPRHREVFARELPACRGLD